MGQRERRRTARIKEIAGTFPSLRNAPGIEPWDPAVLDDWASKNMYEKPFANERYAARFLLQLWSEAEEWKSGRFEVFVAIEFWDRAHAEAFAAWCLDPRWFGNPEGEG